MRAGVRGNAMYTDKYIKMSMPEIAFCIDALQQYDKRKVQIKIFFGRGIHD